MKKSALTVILVIIFLLSSIVLAQVVKIQEGAHANDSKVEMFDGNSQNNQNEEFVEENNEEELEEIIEEEIIEGIQETTNKNDLDNKKENTSSKNPTLNNNRKPNSGVSGSTGNGTSSNTNSTPSSPTTNQGSSVSTPAGSENIQKPADNEPIIKEDEVINNGNNNNNINNDNNSDNNNNVNNDNTINNDSNNNNNSDKPQIDIPTEKPKEDKEPVQNEDHEVGISKIDFYSFTRSNISLTQNENEIIFSGTMPERELINGLNSGQYLEIKIVAPKNYSSEVLNKAKLTMHYSNTVITQENSQFLENVDNNELAYFYLIHEFMPNKTYQVTIDWGNNLPITYSFTFNIEVQK